MGTSPKTRASLSDVETVRKSFYDKERPFTMAEIQRELAVADTEGRSLILFCIVCWAELN